MSQPEAVAAQQAFLQREMEAAAELAAAETPPATPPDSSKPALTAAGKKASAPKGGLKRAGTIDLNVLNPDRDGDGRVSKFEDEVYNRLKSLDKDRDGILSAQELYNVVQEMTRKSRSKRAYRRLFLAAAGFSLLLVIILAGMTAILVFAFKDTYAQRALLTDATSNSSVMKTSPAKTPLPLIVAPVLRWEQLWSVRSLTVTVVDDSQIAIRQSTLTISAVRATRRRLERRGGRPRPHPPPPLTPLPPPPPTPRSTSTTPPPSSSSRRPARRSSSTTATSTGSRWSTASKTKSPSAAPTPRARRSSSRT